MAHRANPAYSFATRLRSLLALLCLLAFAAAPMNCTAAVPGMPAAHADSVESDCHPCCSHGTPANVTLGCCTTPQEATPARLAESPALHPVSTIAWLEDLPVPMQTSAYATPQTRVAWPPPPRLVALRI